MTKSLGIYQASQTTAASLASPPMPNHHQHHEHLPSRPHLRRRRSGGRSRFMPRILSRARVKDLLYTVSRCHGRWGLRRQQQQQQSPRTGGQAAAVARVRRVPAASQRTTAAAASQKEAARLVLRSQLKEQPEHLLKYFLELNI